MSPVIEYPWVARWFHVYPNCVNPPTWCPACKKQINPGDPCRETQIFWACEQEECFNFVRHCEEYPHEGPAFYNHLYQHTRYLDRQKSQSAQGFEYLTWLEWCVDQGKTIIQRGGISFVPSYLDVHGTFPDQFRKVEV